MEYAVLSLEGLAPQKASLWGAIKTSNAIAAFLENFIGRYTKF